jgi:hypothetical protein
MYLIQHPNGDWPVFLNKDPRQEGFTGDVTEGVTLDYAAKRENPPGLVARPRAKRSPWPVDPRPEAIQRLQFGGTVRCHWVRSGRILPGGGKPV